MTSLVLRSSIIAALGGLLFGFDTAVISGTTGALKEVFGLTDFWLGMTVSSALWGTILGAATIQFPANKWGRKPTLAFIAILYLISAIGSAFPRSLTFWADSAKLDWISFMFFRILGGIGVGGASVVSPLYTAEIAPPKRRGFLVALTQFNIVFGILVAYVSNYIIGSCGLGEDAWRWMFGVEAIPAFVFWVALTATPESPRWLIAKERFEEGLALLKRLVPNDEDAQREFKAIQESLVAERSQGKERFFCWRYRKPILLAFAIAAFNQLSGINAVLYYAPTVFQMAGASEETALALPMYIGLANFVFTIIALFLIDGFGRKKLMFVGSIGYIVSLAVVGTIFATYSAQFKASIERIEQEKKQAEIAATEEAKALETPIAQSASNESASETSTGEVAEEVVANEGVASDAPEIAAATATEVPKMSVYGILLGLIVFIAGHAFGQGACIWVFIGEIFPNAVRAQGQALGCFTHWIMNAIVSGFFPATVAIIGPSAAFFGFCGFMVLQLLWVLFIMPETKQIPLEEMQKKLGIVE